MVSDEMKKNVGGRRPTSTYVLASWIMFALFGLAAVSTKAEETTEAAKAEKVRRILEARPALAGPLSGFVPYGELPFSSANREMCAEVLNKWDVQPVPQLPVSETSAVKNQCPTVDSFTFKMNEHVRLDKSSLFRADIDNDGLVDTVVYHEKYFSRFSLHNLSLLDSATCKLRTVMISDSPIQIVSARGRAYALASSICRGPYPINGEETNLTCKSLFMLDGQRLPKEFKDELCVFIDARWVNIQTETK